jgi:hypothetical protein
LTGRRKDSHSKIKTMYASLLIDRRKEAQQDTFAPTSIRGVLRLDS